MKILNSNGDKLQPCLSPNVTLNHSAQKPLMRTQEETTVYSDLMACNIVPPIPKCSSLCHNNSQLTESCAF